jgi:hypothetical protein
MTSGRLNEFAFMSLRPCFFQGNYTVISLHLKIKILLTPGYLLPELILRPEYTRSLFCNGHLSNIILT